MSYERTGLGVKGRDRNGVEYAIFYFQVKDIEKRPYGCDIRLDTGEAIPLNMGYDRAKGVFTK